MGKSYTRKFKCIVKVLTILLVLNVSDSWGQTNLVGFDFENNSGPSPSIDNVNGTPAFTSFGVNSLAFSNSSPCTGTYYYGGNGWAVGNYYRITFDGTGFRTFVLTFKDKTTNIANNGFKVRISTDLSTWTDVVSTYTPGISCNSRTSGSFPCVCDNSSTIYVDFYKVDAPGGSYYYRLDDILITGFSFTPPTILPASQILCGTSTTTININSVAATPSFTWQGSANGTSGWATVAGGTPIGTTYSNTTSATLSLTTSSNYFYRAIVDEGNPCTFTTSVSSITVNTAPTVTLQPTNKTICSGKSTTFKVGDSGNPTSYQWQVKVPAGSFVNITNGGVYSGATTATLTLTNVPASMNTYSYQCVLTVAGCATSTTSIVTLSVNVSPPAPPAPTPLANPACNNTYLTAVTSTVAGVTWYWESTSALGTSTLNLSTSNYYVGISDIYYLGARDNTNGCFTTTGTSVTVNLDPIVTSHPTDKSICDPSNTTFAVVASNATGYQWQVDNGGGFVNCTGAPYSNFTTNSLTITGATAGMNIYKYRCVISGLAPCASVVSNSATLTITASADPTTGASSASSSDIGCNAFNLSFIKGNGSNRLVVVKSGSAVSSSPVDGTSYTASSTFGSGSAIVAGEFVTYNGTGSSVFITGLSASTTYYYAIFEFNGCNLNYLTSGTVPNGSVTTTSCTFPAGITGVYIDACGSTTCPSEGSNELIWGTSGSYGMAVNNNGPTLHYNSTTAPVTTYISSYSQNASNITALNTAVGACGTTTFVDPNTQGYIPPNSKFLIANNCMCSPSVYDFSGLCGAGPIYVVFGTDASWPCNTNGGIFGNYSPGGTTRYFDLNMNTWGVALAPIYNYTIGSLSGSGDGDIILMNPVGGAATTYSNSVCKVPLIILPVELLDFYATKNGKGNEVIWKVAQEENILYYTIEKSKDAIDFTEFATVYSTNGMHAKSYSVFDSEPYRDITYYRLSTKEINGTAKNYKIISVNEADNKWEYIHYQTENNLVLEFKNALPKNSVVSLYDISGKELITQPIKQSQTMLDTEILASGVYFVRLATPYKTEHFKIIISK